MDAYDMFKKLTKGIKFPKHKNTSTPKDLNNIPQRSIKNETVDTEIKVKKEKEKSDNSITLLSSWNKEHEQRKGKKRKMEENCKEFEIKKRLLEKEEVNRYRNINNISVVGTKVPEPVKTFEELQVDSDIKENLKACGYTEPTAIQKQAIPIMLDGRQMLACAPTGSGKTAAFLVPVIKALGGPQKQGFRALVLCPTRELAKQTQRECIRLSDGRSFRIHVISKINKALAQYGPNSNQKFDILITTPNRLCFLLNQDPPAISLSNIKWIIVDEADKLFEEGSRSFRDQLNQILNACTNVDKKIAMFSATYTPQVAKWCVHNMKKLIRVTVGQRNAATDLVDQELLFVGNEQGKLLAFRDLVKKGIAPPVLVFVQSKDRAQQLFNELIYDGINVDAIHADRTQLQRDNTVRSFREGKIWVLICTELMARGIDFKGVNLVVNYDFPPSAISYVHRIGRAGRAGRRGKAITFFTTEDTINLRSIAHVLKESGCDVPSYMLAMKKKSKKERKKLEKSAPKRDHILTKPKYEKSKRHGKRREANSSNLTENSVKDSTNEKKHKSPKIKKSKGNIKVKTNTLPRNDNIKNKTKKSKIKVKSNTTL